MMTPSVLIEHLHVDGAGPTPGLPLLATATLYVAVAAAGLLAAPALTGVDDTRRSRVAVTGLAGAAYVGLLVALAATARLDIPRFAVAAAVATGAAATLSRAPRDRLVAAAALVGSQLLLPASSDGGSQRLLIGVHLVAATVWLGGTAHLALMA